VSLRKALAALPDDRSTRSAIHGVVSYLDTHRDEPFDLYVITRRTGIDAPHIELVLRALASAFVITATATRAPHRALSGPTRCSRSKCAASSGLQGEATSDCSAASIVSEGGRALACRDA